MKTYSKMECKNKIGKLECEDLFNCCDCGGNNCGCYYCWSCNSCDVCNSEIGINFKEYPIVLTSMNEAHHLLFIELLEKNINKDYEELLKEFHEKWNLEYNILSDFIEEEELLKLIEKFSNYIENNRIELSKNLKDCITNYHFNSEENLWEEVEE